VYQKLWKELKNSALIQRLLMYPGLFSMVMNRAVSSSYLQQSLIKMIDDLNEREKLGKPAFYLKALIKK